MTVLLCATHKGRIPCRMPFSKCGPTLLKGGFLSSDSLGLVPAIWNPPGDLLLRPHPHGTGWGGLGSPARDQTHAGALEAQDILNHWAGRPEIPAW